MLCVCSREINRYLKQLKTLAAAERTDELMAKMGGLVKKLELICTSVVSNGEVPNPMKFIQMHMKHVLFNSEKVKGYMMELLSQGNSIAVHNCC